MASNSGSWIVHKNNHKTTKAEIKQQKMKQKTAIMSIQTNSNVNIDNSNTNRANNDDNNVSDDYNVDNEDSLHADDIFDSDQKEIIESTLNTSSSQSTQLLSTSNGKNLNDNTTKSGTANDNQSKNANVYSKEELYPRYESFSMSYNCIDSSIHSFECIVCCCELLYDNAHDIDDNWELIKVIVENLKAKWTMLVTMDKFKKDNSM